MKSAGLYQRDKQEKTAGLNLVSLMDIFTILVFFLLMNSGESQEIESAKFITLPDSQAKSSFTNDLLITITKEFVLVDEQETVRLQDVQKMDGKAVPELLAALKAHAETQPELTEFQEKNGRPVTIMGDQKIPYGILRSVMASCSEENYRDIALAVNQVVSSAVVEAGP